MPEHDTAPGIQVVSEGHLGGDVRVAPGAVVHEGVQIAAGSQIGSGAVLYPGTRVGERCVIEAGAILGKRPRLRDGSSAPTLEDDDLVLGAEVTVCCNAVLYAGARIGSGTIVGDQVQVREGVTVGADTIVGCGSSIEFGAAIGARVRIQTRAYITANSVVEDDVFVGPGVVTTNDSTMGRHARGEALRGPVFRRACRVGGGAVFVPGIVVGEEAFVAAGALVTRDVDARAVVMGVPARAVRQVGEEDLLERWR